MIQQAPAVAHGLGRRFHELRRLVGNTPLLSIEFTFEGKPRTIYAKSEQLNMTGSIKDRMALQILEQGYIEGTLRPGDTIAEATSGNTGISFAAIGAALGHPVVIFMPDWMSRERVDLIKSFGARIIPVARSEGGFPASIRRAEQLHEHDRRVFLPCQFSNTSNPDAHAATTGPEIWNQLSMGGLEPDAFVAGVGTGGTVMGVGRYLRAMKPSVRVHPLEPAESPTLSTGHKIGHHRIQGISDDFIPPVVSLSQLDPVVAVHDGDAILMAQKLARNLGLGVGISSGANFVGALTVQNELGCDAVVVTVFPDSNKKYLSTDLLHDEPVEPEYLSPRVELTGFGALPRVCASCCEF